MNFGFNEEQNMLRDSVRRFLDQHAPLSTVRQLKTESAGYSEAHWLEMAELGWLGIIVPPEYGGIGLHWIDLVVVLEEMGRSVFPSPFASNTLAAAAILECGSQAQQAKWLPPLVKGSHKSSVALFEESGETTANAINLTAIADGDGFVLSGSKCNVMDPESADSFVVSFRTGNSPQELGLAIVEASAVGVKAQAFPLIDETKRMGNLTLDNVKVPAEQVLKRGEGTHANIERMIDQGAIAITAEISGACDSALQLTVGYAKERSQFGHPIGKFQGVKHPLAESYVDLESFRSLLYYGAWAVDSRPEELSRNASLAKAYATDTFIRMGTDSILFHGAAGYTVAFDIHLFYMRSKWARPMYGDANTHYERALALRLGTETDVKTMGAV